LSNSIPSHGFCCDQISEGVARIVQKEEVESKEEQDKLTATFTLAEQVVNVLWLLAESTEDALKEITNANIIPLLFELVNPGNGFSLKLAEAAGMPPNSLLL
jgi:hypothetical protein